jgi:signal transduction histidine kinase
LTGLLYLENNLATGVFSPPRVEMVRLMAGQAAIAIENARLYEDLENRVQLRTHELAQSNERLSATLARLKETQKQLIAQEKLASLGALSSGIAHEIKNPLNFIVNFAQIATRLVDELTEVLQQDGAPLDSRRRENVNDLLNDIKESCSAVHLHGNRADNIIKAMLQHARKGIEPSARRDVDINALVRETLRIANPERQDSDAALSSCFVANYDETMQPIAVAPHDIGRVFLNLINNAFFAVNGRRRALGASFAPEIRFSTQDLGDRVEIRVWDNGGGIPVAIRDKIFEPFFTTKSAGDGTGLGLSLSREIIVEGHGGSIDLHSIENEFTEFVIQLPRRND